MLSYEGMRLAVVQVSVQGVRIKLRIPSRKDSLAIKTELETNSRFRVAVSRHSEQ
jgi:hypothetical protein